MLSVKLNHYVKSLRVVFPAACCDRIDPNHMVNTSPLGAGMVYFK
jgi:hypothetical protein